MRWLLTLFAGLQALTAQAATEKLDGVFALSFTAELSLAAKDMGADGLSITGRLDRSAQGLVLSDLECARAGPAADGAGVGAICRALAGPIPWQLAPGGALVQLQLRPGLSITTEAMLKGIASLVPFALAEGEIWRVTESDTMGRYQAEYRRTGDRIDRRKRRYLQLADQGGLRPIRSGELAFDARATADLSAGRLDRLVVEEHIRRAGAGLDLPEATVSTRLTLTRIETAPRAAPVALGGGDWVRPYDPVRAATVRRTVDLRKIAGRDYAMLKMQATLPDGRRRDTTEARQAMIALAALMRQSAQSRRRAIEECAAAGPGCRVAITALGVAGDPDSQQALREIFALASGGEDSVRRAHLRRETIRALGTRSGGPLTGETRALLVRVLNDPTVGSQAAYGLGAEAFRRRQQNDPSSADFLLPLLAALEGGGIVALNAIGNSGSPEAIPALQVAVRDGNDAAAAAAITALRRMPAESAGLQAILLDALEDRRPGVRQAALAVVQMRGGSDALRSKLREIVAAGGSTAPMARRALERWQTP